MCYSCHSFLVLARENFSDLSRVMDKDDKCYHVDVLYLIFWYGEVFPECATQMAWNVAVVAPTILEERVQFSQALIATP